MKSDRADAGFTLLELLVVLLVIVLVTGVFTTTIGGGFGVHIRNASRTLGAELEYVGQRAITTGRIQRMVIDLDRQLYRVEELPPLPVVEVAALPEHAEGLDLAPPLESLEFQPVDGLVGEWRALDDADEVRFSEIRMADEAKQDGAIAIGFAPDGACDPAEIWLRDDGGYDMRIRLVAFTGEIRIEEPEPEKP